MATILLVEPDILLGRIYLTSLQMAGHDVSQVSSAQQAVHAIDRQLPDIIVLELQLADHSGVEFLYELRSYPEWQAIPIVVHSLVPQYLFSDNTKQIQKMGIAHYLYKPSANLAQLNRAVTEALEPVHT